MIELRAIVQRYNSELDTGLNDKQREAYISVILDIKAELEGQIKQIEQSKLLLPELNNNLSVIRFIIQSIRTNDRIILP